MMICLMVGVLSKAEAQQNKLVFQHLTTEDGLSHNIIMDIVGDKRGFVWIGTRNGLDRYDGYEIKHYKHNPNNPSSLNNNWIYTMYKDREENIWIRTAGQSIDRYNYQTDDFTHCPYDSVPAYIRQSLEDRISIFKRSGEAHDQHGNLWKITKGGLDKYNPYGQIVQNVRYDATIPNGLSHDEIYSLFIDKQNVMWVATGQGLNKADLERKEFHHLYRSSTQENGLLDNNIRALAIDQNKVMWIGTYDKGVCRYDPSSGNFSYYTAEDDKLLSNYVRNLFIDASGTVWVGTRKGGLTQLGEGGLKSVHYGKGDGIQSLPADNLYAINEDGNQNLWLGTFSGLSILDKTANRFYHYYPDENAQHSLSHRKVRDIYKDTNGTMWIATEGGLNKAILSNSNDYESLTFETFTTQKYYDQGLVVDFILSICESQPGTLWLGTQMGLIKMDVQANTYRYFGIDEGLSDLMIYRVLSDDNGFLWMSHNKGLSKFDPKTEQFTNFTAGDGLQGSEFSEGAGCKDPSGKLYFGGTNGISYFEPLSIKNNPYKPQVMLTDLKIFNRSVSVGQKVNGMKVLDRSISYLQDLVLSYRHKIISLEFVALHKADSKSNQYAYMLEGYEDDWNYTDASKRSATYTSLPGGNYTFLLKASNADGLWMEKPSQLRIKVIPPFWLTWWFRVTLGLAFVIMSVIIYRRRTIKIKADQSLLEEKVNEATSKVQMQNEELKEQKDSLQDAIEDTNFVISEAIESGNFKARVDTSTKTGAWKELGMSINRLFESVLSPFEEVNAIVLKMSEGDLTRRYTKEAKGDIEQMANNLNQALDNVSQLLMDITGQVEQIGSSSQEMRVSTEQMNVSTGEIASAIAEMNSGAQSQVNKVDESSNLVEGIMRFSQETGNQAELINKAAKTGVEQSDSGIKLIGKVTDSMGEIISFSKQSNVSIEDLSRRSDEISRVLNFIKEVAAQTNLLALNAAIEAAQAGDAGRGFSVVAEEIRKLAEDAKNSTKEIEILVEEIQNATSATAKLIGDMGNSIKIGEVASTDASGAFQAIASSYANTLELSEKIVEATKQQTSDVRQVVGITESIVVIAEETAAGTEEIASSSTELSSGMTEYSEKTRQVSDIVQELIEKVGRFKLGASKELEAQDA